MPDIVSVVICVEDATAAAPDIREIVVEDEEEYRAQQTSLGNSLVSNILRVSYNPSHASDLAVMYFSKTRANLVSLLFLTGN